MLPWRFNCLVIVSVLSSAATAFASDYETQVKPLLRSRCFACHGALKQEGGLRLDTVKSIRSGGDSGEAITAGDPAASYLLDRVTASDESERMPPEGKPLTADEIKTLREWIRSGAEEPENEAPESDPRDHWAFQDPVRVTPEGGEHPIDAFLARLRSQHSIESVGEVDRGLLLRRVYLDLIGVPPNREELSQFLNDSSPDAFERVVDRLLASPRYGERWGRHWMDVWRYSDWYGLGKQLRYSQKHIWRWRDWIVESLNDDLGYDEMVQLMLAADELRPESQGDLRATGFLARNYYLFNRTTWLDNTIEHTSKSLLGLTVNCAKCHDHKYDAISQHDYYAMRAIFEPHQVRLDPVPGVSDLEKDGLPRVFDAHPEMETFLHIRGDAKNLDKSSAIAPGVLNVVLAEGFDPKPVDLPPAAVRPALLPFVRTDRLEQAENEIAAAEAGLAKAESDLKKAKLTLAIKSAEKLVSTLPAKTYVDESFDQMPDPLVWNIEDGEWSIKDGQLVQLKDGASRASLRTKANHPVDFHATLEFTTIGGSKWRSVGICFDAASDHENMVYLSAVQPGSKLQVSHMRKGQQSYPPSGRVDRKVALNTRYTIELFVRDRIVNVSIDGKHALAYALPDARRAGKLVLVAFDAKVHFANFKMTSLTTGHDLVVPKGAGGAGLTLKQTGQRVEVAKRKLAAAKLYPAALDSALSAELTQLSGRDAKEARSRAISAHIAWQIAKAKHDITAAELEIDEKKRTASRKAATKKLDQLNAQQKKGAGEPLKVQASLKALEGPAEKDASRRAAYPQNSTGRRTALAKWITDRRNPLTARVAVNQVWMRHFGQPLVDPVDDFGRRTKAPVQLELLDYLAVEFMESGWSFKELHRLIVTSAAYRLSTSTRDAEEATLKRDPTNQYYWRRTPRRMESESIRDSLLHLAGTIDWRFGGPSVKPQGKNGGGRRSLYFTHSRDDQHAFLVMFDHADILRCYRRSESIVPQQALTLANSRMSLEAARQIAARMDSGLEDATFVQVAFETILTRRPNEDETQACLEVLDQLRSASPKTEATQREQRARANLVHALINHNDFVTIR